MQLNCAEHILEIACGRCCLVPYAVTLKSPKCTYLASDLTPNMMDEARLHLQHWLQSTKNEHTLEEWCKLINLSLEIADGEMPFNSPHKFDRIICNLVLQITPDPVKMLRNLWEASASECLLGLTIWGDKNKFKAFSLANEIKAEMGLPVPHERTNFHTYNRVPELAAASGWEVVLLWEQTAPFPFIQDSHELNLFVESCTNNDPLITPKFKQILLSDFLENRPITFYAQLAILRKIIK